MHRSPARRLTAAIATGLTAAALAFGGGIALASPAIAASDPPVLTLSLDSPWSEDGGVQVSGSCPVGTLGAAAVDEARSVMVLLWPDGNADLSTEHYTPGLGPGETVTLQLRCYDLAYSSATGFEGANVLGTVTQSITNPDHGSFITTAPQVAENTPIVVEFFCGPEGDNANVDASLVLFRVDPSEALYAQVAAVAPGHPFGFGTPAELGIEPGTTLYVSLLCTADIEGEEGPVITSQRYATTLVANAPTPPVQVHTAVAGR